MKFAPGLFGKHKTPDVSPRTGILGLWSLANMISCAQLAQRSEPDLYRAVETCGVSKSQNQHPDIFKKTDKNLARDGKYIELERKR